MVQYFYQIPVSSTKTTKKAFIMEKRKENLCVKIFWTDPQNSAEQISGTTEHTAQEYF